MLNIKFTAMKKIIFLLFLTCVIVLPGLAQVNNSNEKFYLTPKIKQGDTWKMVVDVGNHNLIWTEDDERFKAVISSLFNPELITQRQLSSVHLITC